MSDKLMRDSVCREFGAMEHPNRDVRLPADDRKMADEIVRLRRILDALREPSEAVLKAAVLNYGGDLTDAIRAAVAAAEQEVSNDAR